LPQEATITATVATRHYGISVMEVAMLEDKGQPKVWDSYKQKDKVCKMKWYIYQVRAIFFIVEES
jgi:hypothetical protein